MHGLSENYDLKSKTPPYRAFRPILSVVPCASRPSCAAIKYDVISSTVSVSEWSVSMLSMRAAISSGSIAFSNPCSAVTHSPGPARWTRRRGGCGGGLSVAGGWIVGGPK